MSRIGKKPISLPQGVSVTVEQGNTVRVKGPKGELSQKIHEDMKVSVEENVVTVERPTDEANHRALHGLSRTLIANMVTGVSEGYKKELEIVGVGYRAQKQGKKLVLNMGFSHPVEMEEPAGITYDVPSPTQVVVSGIDKQLVGEMAANVRKVRPPEPYKGKGIKYANEYIRRKVGKAGK